MQYKEFVTNLAEDLQEELVNRNRDVCVKVINIEKPWGTEVGIEISEGKRVNPVMYPKDLFEMFENGQDYFFMLDAYADKVEFSLDNTPVHEWTNLEALKDSITMHVINLERAKKYLEDKPYKQFEDLAIIYKLNFNIGNNEKGSATVTLSMMERLGFTKEELHQFAIEKFPLNAPCSIENLSDALRRTEPDLFADLPESPLTIVTNKEGVLGAGSVFCPGVLEKCTNVMNGNFYVLPSSIHEMLICREGDTLGLEKLKEIVCVANETEVRKEEFLSDNVYHYDWKEKVFELAEKYEARMKEKAKQSLMGNLESKKYDVARDDHLRRNQDIGSRRTQGGSLCL